jgi:DNA-binding SARP family transcriptional activator
MARLDLALLGPVRVALGDRSITHFDYDKVPALLAYLLVEADRPHTRDELAALLWPESSADAARRSLRVALTRLRHTIADQTAHPPLLLIDRTTIRINPAANYTLDVAQFARLLALVEQHGHASGTLCETCATHLAEAVALYGGEFLAQVRVRDSAAFEEWVTLVRERLHQRAVEALGRLLTYHEHHGDYPAAESSAWRLLALEPWDEAAHRCLMRIHAVRGQRAAALAQYERCRRVLAAEFNAAPAPETTALYECIRDGGRLPLASAVGPTPSTPIAPLIATPPDRPEVPQSAPAPPPADRNRQRLLEKVRAFWIDGVLAESLRLADPLPLALAWRPDAVARPWDLIVRPLGAPPRPLPPETPISAVFDEMGGELLILGAPGAGKTTLLLELTAALLERAGQDPALPMPVVFNLASWAARRIPLAEWLVDELDERYQVPRALGRRWVESEQILPLLDGLDEVALQHRAACVTAINAFRAQHWLLDIVVCSRSADYALLTEKLRLQGAVEIQPLTDAQVERYLAHGGARLAAVQASLREDAALRELAETPLMLNIMALAYRSDRDAHLHARMSLEQRRAHLFQTYIRQMLRPHGSHSRYPPQQTVRWLAWLARTLMRQSQTMLLIERIQPAWLPTSRERWVYTASVALTVGLIFGACFSLFGGLTAALLYDTATGHSFMLLAGIVGTLVAGLVVGVTMAPGAQRRWFGGSIGRSARNAALFGVALGGLIGALARVAGHPDGLIVGLYSGLLVGLIAGVLASRIPPGGQIVAIEQLRWSWPAARRAAGQHLARGAAFGLVSGAALCLALAVRSPWPTSLANGAGFGVTVTLATAVVLTINSGLTPSEVEVTQAPNQGIWRSAQHMAAIGLATSLLIGLIGMLANLVSFSLVLPDAPLSRPLLRGLLSSPILGLAAGMFYGGLACVQHTLLRLHLWRLGAMPLNYVRFLDEATRQVLLRRIGGGYMFIHRLLLEHFATLDPDTPFVLPPDAPDAAPMLPDIPSADLSRAPGPSLR